MAKTLSEFQTSLRGPLGREDATGDGFITKGVNFACLLIALLYDPPELQTSSSVTVSASAKTASLSALTRLMNVKMIFNETALRQVWRVPLPRLNLVSPLATAATSSVKFYSRDNTTLHVRPVCSSANTLTVYYSQFPLTLTNSGDAASFDNFDSLIETYALAYAQACLDESDLAAAWNKLGESLAVPQQILLKTRQYLEGGPSHGDDTF